MSAKSRLAGGSISGAKSQCTYYFEREQGIELDEAVEVPKNDAHWKEHHVAGVPSKESDKFYDFCEAKHEDELCPEGIPAVLRFPIGGSPPTAQQEHWINDKCEGRKCGNMHRVGAPQLLAALCVSISSRSPPFLVLSLVTVGTWQLKNPSQPIATEPRTHVSTFLSTKRLVKLLLQLLLAHLEHW